MWCVKLATNQPDVMKIQLRAAALGAGLMSLMVCAGCKELSAEAAEAPVVAAADEQKPSETKPAEPKAADTNPAGAAPVPAKAPAVAEDPKGKEIVVAKPETNSVQQLAAPDDLKLTPALADVIKLVQAGVGEEVLMTYITNSADVFNMGPDEILYLHDLGVPPTVITTLIQKDSTPEATARKQAAGAVQPLPPGVALSTPATNVFSPKAPAQPVGDLPAAETASVPAGAPPTDTNPAPAIVYTVPTTQPADVSYFYGELAPYGTWIDYPGYGRCWRPTISVWNSTWRPYADGGRWLWTDHGWYWYSDYSWGSHVFHYGRWTCPPGVGWLWVPDVHWGPAWVSWRYSRSHCGWAPLPPSARWVAGHGFYHNTVSVGFGFEFGLSDHHYLYVPTSRFCDRRPINHCLTPHHSRLVHRETTVFNNYVASGQRPVVNNGVGFDRIASATRGSIRQVSIQTAPGPTVSRSTRREQLDSTGRTLTVTRATAASSAITPPARPITSLSHLQGNDRRTSVTAPQSATVNRTGSTTSSGLGQQDSPVTGGPSTPSSVNSGARRQPIIIRGGSRGNASSTASTGSASPAGDPPATVVDSTPGPAGNSSSPRRTTQPAGGRTAPANIERTRSQSTPPATVVSRPAPSTPQSPARVAARPEPVRTVQQPAVQRGPVASTPVVVQPRAASQPVVRSAPATPRSMPSAPSSPRVESYRAPSPSPAPARSAPAQSSGGGSRSSRSSGDDGGRRGSR